MSDGEFVLPPSSERNGDVTATSELLVDATIQDVFMTSPVRSTEDWAGMYEEIVQAPRQRNIAKVETINQLHEAIEHAGEKLAPNDTVGYARKRAIDDQASYFREYEMTPGAAICVLDKFSPTRVRRPEGKESEESIRQYEAEINSHRLLTKGEEIALAKIIEMGDAAAKELDQPNPQNPSRLRRLAELGYQARDQFIESNLRLVVPLARRHKPLPRMNMSDYVQEGNIALMKAVDSFDWRKGTKFSTHATLIIRRDIARARSEHMTAARTPADVGITYLAAQRARERGEERELASDEEAFKHLDNAVSFDSPASEETTTTVAEVLPSAAPGPEEKAIMSDELAVLMAFVKSKRARYILTRNLNLDGLGSATLGKIADELGISKGTAKTTAARARESIRKILEAQGYERK